MWFQAILALPRNRRVNSPPKNVINTTRLFFPNLLFGVGCIPCGKSNHTPSPMGFTPGQIVYIYIPLFYKTYWPPAIGMAFFCLGLGDVPHFYIFQGGELPHAQHHRGLRAPHWPHGTRWEVGHRGVLLRLRLPQQWQGALCETPREGDAGQWEKGRRLTHVDPLQDVTERIWKVGNMQQIMVCDNMCKHVGDL